MATDDDPKDPKDAKNPWEGVQFQSSSPQFDLDPAAVTSKLAQFIAHAMSELIKSDGIAYARLSAQGSPHDTLVKWLAIDDVPVYRAILIPDIGEDGEAVVMAYGTWLPTYRDFMPGAVDSLPAGLPEEVEDDKDEWEGEKTDPEPDPLVN